MKNREALDKSARAGSEGFFVGKRSEKGWNTGCISPFSVRISGEKDPLPSRRRFIQSFHRGAVILLAMAAALCIFVCGVFMGRNFTGGRLLFSHRPNTPETQSAELVDLNTATAEELGSIPGIGPVLAQRIVEYRQANGSFQNLADLLHVQGVSEKVMESIYQYATIGG